LKFFIDGYNVLLRMRDVSRDDLEAARDQLLHRLILFGEAQGGVLLVWDSRERTRGVAGTNRVHNVTIAYARSADDYLVRAVNREPRSHRNGITVVSSDRDVAQRTQALGARTMGAGAFLQKLDEDGPEFPGYPGEPWEKYFP